MTRNSGIGSGSLRCLPPVVPVGFALDPVGEETSTPTICTRRPTHAVMSVPLKRYPPTLEGELPAGAVPCTFAAVPASGAGAAAGTAGSGGGCAVSGDGATAPAGSTSAFISVIGCDFEPPVTHPVSVVLWGAGTGG
jgi:hypothetical protein